MHLDRPPHLSPSFAKTADAMPKADRRCTCLRLCRRCGCVYFGRRTFCGPACREAAGFRDPVPPPSRATIRRRCRKIQAEWTAEQWQERATCWAQALTVPTATVPGAVLRAVADDRGGPSWAGGSTGDG